MRACRAQVLHQPPVAPVQVPGMSLAVLRRMQALQSTKSGRGNRKRRALLLIDFMNPFDYEGAARLAPRAIKAARNAAQLKVRMRTEHAPVIYANDNFGRWESDFAAVVESCRERGGGLRRSRISSRLRQAIARS